LQDEVSAKTNPVKLIIMTRQDKVVLYKSEKCISTTKNNSRDKENNSLTKEIKNLIDSISFTSTWTTSSLIISKDDRLLMRSNMPPTKFNPFACSITFLPACRALHHQ
jgi:hypothetical protein